VAVGSKKFGQKMIAPGFPRKSFGAHSSFRLTKGYGTGHKQIGEVKRKEAFDHAIKNSAAHDSANHEKLAKDVSALELDKKFGPASQHDTTIAKELLGKK
jgi:hypothetical protein